MLTQYDLDRYDRQMMIPGWGEAGQEKLKKAKVFIAGAGGLGCPLSLYLAVAGIGTIRIVDLDVVALSNLNRQVLHWDEDINRDKIVSAREKLTRVNPSIKIEAIKETITDDNILKLAGDCDVIVDAMDNIATRYTLNRAAFEMKKPFFHGAIYGFEGRAMTVVPGKSACLACLYRGIPQRKKFPVLGTVPALIAMIQATEVIKYITGVGELLTDRILIYDGFSMKFMEISIKKDPECTVCGKGVK